MICDPNTKAAGGFLSISSVILLPGIGKHLHTDHSNPKTRIQLILQAVTTALFRSR